MNSQPASADTCPAEPVEPSAQAANLLRLNIHPEVLKAIFQSYFGVNWKVYYDLFSYSAHTM